MNFRTLAKNVVKGAVAAFTVGALVALALPTIASVVGVSAAAVGASANPLWLGAFFGAWGGLAALVQPAADFIFGGGQLAQTPEKPTSKTSTLTIELSPEQSKKTSNSLGGFQNRVKAGRVAQDNGLSV
jgi:hypothetical protein